MVDRKAGEQNPEKPKPAGAAGVKEGKVPVAALGSDAAEEEAADLPTKPTKISKLGFAAALSVAAAFNEDEDRVAEERPPEAKMRMDNPEGILQHRLDHTRSVKENTTTTSYKLWEQYIKSHFENVHDRDK
ncbi:PEST proteolytic signal-containing nuclear protein [Fukomys damarensis]|uniref:PEST proteolytic signal-containing nuclear protein n=1 Tax=Fukomys damarensis TaxID=885580 RepID=A0A091E1L2_FUKDA|nr:PEST proteolytic signal-containing nuclear protein [Fukomys damarensis]